MPIGDEIKRLRMERGLTQKQLGDLCGMADSAIRKYEKGTITPKNENLKKLAMALEVTGDYLMGWAEEPKVDPMSCIPLGENIKAAREAAGLTQEELGAKLGVTGVTIMRYETGQRELKVDTLYKIADALEIGIQRLLGKPITLKDVCDQAKRIDGAVRIGRRGGDEFLIAYIHRRSVDGICACAGNGR